MQKIVDNSKYDSGGYLKPNPPSVQDYIEVFPDPVVDVAASKRRSVKTTSYVYSSRFKCTYVAIG
ncbi:hypothetical protein A1I_07030 [Rickettsia bellii OSU 85-389]|nr:hypothetical protein A1I_07030 [Rickettsia bellii OSU 85-389]